MYTLDISQNKEKNDSFYRMSMYLKDNLVLEGYVAWFSRCFLTKM